MFQYDDDRKTSRAAHDSPVIPRPVWQRRGIPEAEYERIRQERAERKDNAIREEARAVMRQAAARMKEYQDYARANIRDMALLRHILARYDQLKTNLEKLSAEFVLARDNTINPQKTIVFYTDHIRELLNTPVELPKSTIRIMTREEYKKRLADSRAMSPGTYKKYAAKIQPHMPPTEIGTIIAEFHAKGKTTPESEKAAMQAILEAKKAERLKELGL